MGEEAREEARERARARESARERAGKGGIVKYLRELRERIRLQAERAPRE